MLFKQDLSLLPIAYTGKPQYMEIMPSDDSIYLQKVEGCGYTPFELTPEEAVSIGEALAAAGRKLLKVA